MQEVGKYIVTGVETDVSLEDEDAGFSADSLQGNDRWGLSRGHNSKVIGGLKMMMITNYTLLLADE